MPGSKRKQDEDTWLIFQSKKCKTNQLSERIYESTLAKLRNGARAYFSPNQGVNEPPVWSTCPESSSNQPAISNVSTNMRNIHLSSGGGHEVPSRRVNNLVSAEAIPVCSDCQWNESRGHRTYFDKCDFCDKQVCHVNSCASCGDKFCRNCYIRRYDDPTSDTYVCISCLS